MRLSVRRSRNRMNFVKNSADFSLGLLSKPVAHLVCILYISGHIYFIGGHADYRFPQAVSRTVTRLCIADGSSRKMQPLSHPVVRPAVAASRGSIVVCGGTLQNSPVSTCQVFSLRSERLVVYLSPFSCFLRGAEYYDKLSVSHA